MNFESITTPWEKPEKDQLNRKKYADFLTKYLETQKSSFVLNLNAAWGMGKTFFISNWRKEISEIHPTVYINAWESDFSEDPILSVMAALNQQLLKNIQGGAKAKKDIKKILNLSGRLLQDVAPVIAKGIANRYLGIDEENLTAFTTDKSIADLASKTMEFALKKYDDKVNSISEFREVLKDIVEDVTKKGVKKPLFIFIDELDRCRPTYAIELLEIVKHLFTVEGVVFVIATDSEQLQHSIRAIYGNGFNGQEYLRRFFDQEYALPEPDYELYCKFIAETFIYEEKLNYTRFQPWCLNDCSRSKPKEWNKSESFCVFLTLYAEYFNISLRSLNQVVVRLNAIISNSKDDWDGPFLLFLLIAQAKNKEIITELRLFCETNHIDKREKFWGEKTSNLGSKVRWLHQDTFAGKTVNKYYNIREIINNYAVAIAQVKNSNHDSLLNLINSVSGNDLKSFIIRDMSNRKLNENYSFPDLYTYFNHIEMAGALS